MLPDRAVHGEDHRQFLAAVRHFFRETLVPRTAAWPVTCAASSAPRTPPS